MGALFDAGRPATCNRCGASGLAWHTSKKTGKPYLCETSMVTTGNGKGARSTIVYSPMSWHKCAPAYNFAAAELLLDAARDNLAKEEAIDLAPLEKFGATGAEIRETIERGIEKTRRIIAKVEEEVAYYSSRGGRL